MSVGLDRCSAKTEGWHSDDHVIARAKPVAISWNNVQIQIRYQEIAAPSARNDSGDFGLVLLIQLGSY